MNDELIEKLHCIYKNLFNLKKLDGKLLDGDVLLFNYKYLELFVDKYVGCLNGTNTHRSDNHINYYLSNINTEIDRLIYATSDTYSNYEVCGRIHFENIVFFKELCKHNMRETEIDKSKIIDIAKEILDSRQEKGIKTYGTTLDEANLSDKELLNHAIEEVADLFLYLTKLKHK